ncbi:hypothetical protein HS088_TW09G00764 [Tripterygium wilfordii]|uniref:Bromo domain-containing protein n=1 Tax=Tripterygium wilfordii TaxID=458696 RepID=A0A7J7D8L6_TRIWF|nr:uncharacterized protein LOC120005382 [Tripterygium wilfordii]KAF5742710.1 hypothetical protein HS088_TW09G00764 [Tripterygium wilfordii]
MSSGERKSSRIIEREAQKAKETKNRRKGRDTCQLPRGKDVDSVQVSSKSKSRKKAKNKHVEDLVLNTVDSQVQKADIQCYNEDHHINSVTMSSRTALPEKGKLEILLGVLKRKDSNKYFAQPVDPKKVKYYDEVIKEPMDFGTIAKKLNEGRYEVLEEFEYDVVLVSRNAMHFNGPRTVYYKEAEGIKELSEQLFRVLKTEPENFEDVFSKAEMKFPNSKSWNKRTNTQTKSKEPRNERRFEYTGPERRRTYKPLSSLSEESSVLILDGESKALNQVNQNGVGYVESILRFAKDLGPTAQKFAMQMAKGCSSEDFKIENVASSFQFQAPMNRIPAAFSSEMGTEIAPPSNSLENFVRSLGCVQSDSLNGEKISAAGNMNRYYANFGGIAHASEKRETPANFQQKIVQTRNSYSNFENAFANDVINKNDGLQLRYFPVSSSQNGTSSMFTGWKSNVIPNKLLSSNMMQDSMNEDKPVQTVEIAFPKPTMQEFFRTRNIGAPSYSWWCSSKAAPELIGRQAFSSMQGEGSQYLGSEMHQVQAATVGGCGGFRSHLEQEGQVLNGLKAPVQKSQYFQALTIGGKSYGGNLNQGGRLSSGYDLPIVEPTLSRGLTDEEVSIMNGGNLEMGGLVRNQFKPTVLGTTQMQTMTSQQDASSRGDFRQGGQVYNLFNLQSWNHNSFKQSD